MTKAPEAECCPQFNVEKWDNKIHNWENKKFIKDNVTAFLHIPLNFSSVVERMFKKADAVSAAVQDNDFLILAYDPSLWKSELYMSVNKEVPDAENVTLSGKFVSKVFDGPYSEVSNWIKKMEQYLQEQKLVAKKYYFHYAYCPKCAKKFGHNYCVAFAEV